MTGLASVCNDCHVWKEFYSPATYLLALMFLLPPLLQSPLSIREGGVNMFRTEPSVGTYSQHHRVTMGLHLLLLIAKKTLIGDNSSICLQI